MSTVTAVDQFAGPGGWSEACRELGVEELGIEFDDSACATRDAAGHQTLQADIATLAPDPFACDLLIGSPPCPTFSTAGDQAGNIVIPIILACATALSAGDDTRAQAREDAYAAIYPVRLGAEREAAAKKRREPNLARVESRSRRDAAMTVLVVEPLRFALALNPRFIALEQVPPVLPIWRFIGDILRARGYSVWCGLLNAADYGVPQTRTRAFLIASRERSAQPPRATHCRDGALTLDGELLPWVSMAVALGWGMTARPSTSLVAGSQRQGGIAPLDGGSGARATIQGERDSGRWLQRRNSGPGAERTPRSSDEPSYTIRAAGSGPAPGGVEWVEVEALEERQAHGVRGEPHEPAPTITASLDNGNMRFIVNTRGERAEGGGNEFDADEPSWAVTGRARPSSVRALEDPERLLHTNRGQDEHGLRQTRDGGSPAPTVSGKSGGQWYWGSPATTIAGDPRITSRSHHEHGEQGRNAVSSQDARAGKYDGRSAIKITLEEAAILQGFRPDYPWQGTRTKCFEQVGNAVPPPLAKAVLMVLLEGAL